MKSNGLLKWLMVPLALVLVFAGIQLFSGGSASSPRPPGTRLTAEEAKTLGIDADTPRDTVATLVGQVKQLRTELQGALADSKTQQAENERLRQREGAIDRRIQSALDAERNQLRTDRDQVAGERQQAQGLLQEVQRQIEGLAGKSGDADLPVGLGLEPDANGAPGAQGMRWIEPDDARHDKKSGVSDQNFSFPTRFGMDKANGASADDTTDPARQTREVSTARPVYTVPTNATLMGSIAMTALIGRVPVDGTVNDPYPFKVLIGPDNLTANGIDIPDVAGAVVSGTASGDWTLSCVRGQIRSVTFVFADGTIRTVPQDRGRGSGHGQQNGTGEGNGNDNGNGTREGLGWISDPHGIPCVSGERRSNAQQYLGTQSLITAAGAGVASLIQSDKGSVAVVANNNGSLGTVGISGNEAMGRILAGGVQDMSQWVNKLYGQAFAAVYVRPGAKVAVHLEQPLTIDYDPKGRKVDHRLGGALHAQDLD